MSNRNQQPLALGPETKDKLIRKDLLAFRIGLITFNLVFNGNYALSSFPTNTYFPMQNRLKIELKRSSATT